MNKKGFTLVEMLVVVSIISFLVLTSLTYLTGATRRGRDARRKAELEQIRSALEMYRADNIGTGYPDVVPQIPQLYFVPTILQTNGYMKTIPQDPQSPAHYYTYFPAFSFTAYQLGAYLEGGNTNPATSCSPPVGLVDISCGSGNNCNYCVFNP